MAQFEENETKVIEPDYGSIEIPVLVLWGEDDGWLHPSFGERLHRAIPNADLKLIPNAGHFVMEDNPDRVMEALARFPTCVP